MTPPVLFLGGHYSVKFLIHLSCCIEDIGGFCVMSDVPPNMNLIGSHIYLVQHIRELVVEILVETFS